VADPLLQVHEIDVFYGDFHALWEVSLGVETAQVASIIGANGAGKSTLLKTIAGVLKPSQGKVTFAEKRIDGLTPYQMVAEGVSMVPEGRRMFARLTVLENLEIGSYVPAARKLKDEALKKIYDLFPVLKERRNQLSSTLSGGEQQMLAIGMSLMAKPKLMLLDEPLLGLSPAIQVKLIESIVAIRKEANVTILICEQFARPVLPIIDRGYVLENGMLTLHGTGEELYNNPEIKAAYFGV